MSCSRFVRVVLESAQVVRKLFGLFATCSVVRRVVEVFWEPLGPFWA